MNTPMVDAFLAQGRALQWSPAQLNQAVKTACDRFPELSDEFEKAGFLRGALSKCQRWISDKT